MYMLQYILQKKKKHVIVYPKKEKNKEHVIDNSNTKSKENDVFDELYDQTKVMSFWFQPDNF